ncbi:hypothetical protein KO481_16575 [Nocardia sp. NEAU-G5]|uniref:Uncharacterized protein n=1 Tax=Nocardia albiluteola TaxID=2842303 RepID=A0ABS6AYL5_9NOCA|nr:hypothetical protein [Nocardia albiluteola]MBU3063137.1 hypothetical protein [Nocardia albiluteola]
MTIDSISITCAHAERRLAILLLRTDIRGADDVRNMRELGARLGYEVADHVVVLDPAVEWPLRTIVRALHGEPGAVMIVPDLEHIDGLDAEVRRMAQVITVEGERVLERAPAGAAAWPGVQP